MDRGQIPGYYFDKEKGKYFKIEKNHAAPTGSKYTVENVRRITKRDRRDEVTNRIKKKIRLHTVQQQHAGNILAQSLSVELGAQRKSYYMQNVWPNACSWGLGKKSSLIVEPGETSIKFFDRDPKSKTLYAVLDDNRIVRRYSDHDSNKYHNQPFDELARTTSIVSSLHYLPASGALVATTQGGERPPTVTLSDPERDGPYVNQQFTPKNITTIWGSTPRPYLAPTPFAIHESREETVAVTTSHSLLMYIRHPDSSWHTREAYHHGRDILSSDWMSHTMLTLGTRPGSIFIHDTRSSGATEYAKHPGPVTTIKAIDPTTILCADMDKKMCLYDLRMSNKTLLDKNDTFWQPLVPESNRSMKRKKRRFSLPLYKFDDGTDVGGTFDVDVDVRAGIVASSQWVGKEPVQGIRIANLWTGKTIKEVKTHMQSQCIRFVDEGNDDGAKSLLVSFGGELTKLGW